MSVEDRIAELGYRLGDPPPPLGQYVRCVVVDGLAFTSGHGPFDEFGEVSVRGQIGKDLSVEEGQEAARISVVACLASLRSAVGSLDEIERIVKLLGFVNCGPGFNETSAVMNGASEFGRARACRDRDDRAAGGDTRRDRTGREGAGTARELIA
jgi:enamine deaminase RidA (YjgF/YER057c/UK114 family)